MAAISNTVEWKQAAMQKAERLTDMWDIVKAWAGRAAEIVLTMCMFAQLIGMLPGVAYATWINNSILGVQIIMLDFGAFALAPLIEHARQIGQEQAAQKAEDMATFLIRLVIVTVVLIIIGQFATVAGPYAWLVTAVVKYSEPVLILVRVGCVVKYIHVIHSLRSTTSLAIHPTHVPTQPVEAEQISKLTTMVETLNSGLVDMRATLSSIQQPTHISEVVEAPTHDLHTTVKPLQMRIVGASTGLHLLTMAATATDTSEDEQEQEPAREAAQEVSYPDVPGVSAEKVRSIISAFESGTKWRSIPGNYSQTVKPVRDAYESLHSDLHTSIQNV
jgi:hypothetical protein